MNLFQLQLSIAMLLFLQTFAQQGLFTTYKDQALLVNDANKLAAQFIADIKLIKRWGRCWTALPLLALPVLPLGGGTLLFCL